MWYKPIPDSDVFDSLGLSNKEDMPLYLEMVTQHYRHRKEILWQTLRIKSYSLNNPGDFPSFMGKFIFTKKSWEVLKYLVEEDVELSALEGENEQFLFPKIVSIIDCLDYKASKYHSRTAEMIGVDTYVFKEDMILDKHLFYLPRAYHAVVSQAFKERVERYGLQGLIFRQL